MKKQKKIKAFLYTLIIFFIIYIFFSSSKLFSLIDTKIENLEKLKRQYKNKAFYHRDKASDLQFIRKELNLAKKHWKLSNNYFEIYKKIDLEIKEIKKAHQNDELF